MINCCLNCSFDAASLIISLFVLNLRMIQKWMKLRLTFCREEKCDRTTWKRRSQKKSEISSSFLDRRLVKTKIIILKKPKDGSIALFNFRVCRLIY